MDEEFVDAETASDIDGSEASRPGRRRDACRVRMGQYFRRAIARTGDPERDRVAQALERNHLVSDKIYEGAVAEGEAYATDRGRGPKVTMLHMLSGAGQTQLQDAYAEYRFDFNHPIDKADHCEARAWRYMERRWVDKLLGLTPAGPISVDYRGNLGEHLSGGHLNVHTCRPVDSSEDGSRVAKAYEIAGRRRGEDNNVGIYSKLLYDAVETIRGRPGATVANAVFCNFANGLCGVKADYVRFMHNIYDLTPSQVARMLARFGAKKAVAVAPFTVAVLRCTSGVIPETGQHFRKVMQRGQTYVDFHFGPGEQQGAYSHPFANIYDWVTASVCYANYEGSVHAYHIVRERRGPSLFITLYPAVVNVPATITRYYLADASLRPTKRMTAYELMPEMAASFMWIQMPQMKKQFITIDAEYLDTLESHANALTKEKFTSEHVGALALTVNTRIKTEGRYHFNNAKLSTHDALLVASEVFVQSYLMRYKISKGISVLIKDIEDVKKHANASDWMKIGIYILRKMRLAKPTQTIDEVYHELNPIADALQESPSYLKAFSDVVRAGYKYPHGLTRFESPFLEITTLTEALQTARSTRPADDAELFQCMEYEVLEGLVSGYDGALIPSGLAELPPTQLRDCRTMLVGHQRHSEGVCALQALIDAGGAPEFELNQLRRTLFRSPGLSMVPRNERLRKYLLSDDHLDSALWPGEEIFHLYAHHFSRNVCLHDEAGNCRLVGNNEGDDCVHIQANEVSTNLYHCEGLTVVQELPPALSVDANSEPPELDPRVVERNARADRLLDDLRRKYPDTFDAALAVAKEAAEVYELGDGRYVSRAGNKTAELDIRYPITKEPGPAVTVGGPGGEAQYLLDCGKEVLGVTLLDEEAPDFSDSVYEAVNFTMVAGDSLDGNILDARNRQSIIETIGPGVVGFFGGDAAVENRQPDVNNQLLSAELQMAVNLLAEGGNGYVKIMNRDQLFRAQHMLMYFDEVILTKILTSKVESDELHMVMKGRNRRPAPNWALGWGEELTQELIDVWTGWGLRAAGWLDQRRDKLKFADNVHRALRKKPVIGSKKPAPWATLLQRR